jgi:hypothetical protein
VVFNWYECQKGGYSFDEGGYLSMKEGVTTTMMRKKGAMGYCPFYYIYMLEMLLFIIYTLSLSIPYLVAPHHGCCLSEALPKLLATNTWRSGGGGGVLADPYFRCLLDRGHLGRH